MSDEARSIMEKAVDWAQLPPESKIGRLLAAGQAYGYGSPKPEHFPAVLDHPKAGLLEETLAALDDNFLLKPEPKHAPIIYAFFEQEPNVRQTIWRTLTPDAFRTSLYRVNRLGVRVGTIVTTTEWDSNINRRNTLSVLVTGIEADKYWGLTDPGFRSIDLMTGKEVYKHYRELKIWHPTADQPFSRIDQGVLQKHWDKLTPKWQRKMGQLRKAVVI